MIAKVIGTFNQIWDGFKVYGLTEVPANQMALNALLFSPDANRLSVWPAANRDCCGDTWAEIESRLSEIEIRDRQRAPGGPARWNVFFFAPGVSIHLWAGNLGRTPYFWRGRKGTFDRQSVSRSTGNRYLTNRRTWNRHWIYVAPQAIYRPYRQLQQVGWRRHRQKRL